MEEIVKDFVPELTQDGRIEKIINRDMLEHEEPTQEDWKHFMELEDVMDSMDSDILHRLTSVILKEAKDYDAQIDAQKQRKSAQKQRKSARSNLDSEVREIIRELEGISDQTAAR